MNPYNSAPILCRRCIDIPADEQNLAAELDGYVKKLAEKLRVSAETYEKRLEICSACPQRAGYTCLKCGCYVQVRAIQKNNGCPNTPPLWGRQ